VPISGDVYKQIGRSAAGAVSIVAAYDRSTGATVGLTASSFVTLSFEPPLVMFAIQHNAGSYASMVSSHAFGVSLLQHTQAEVASLFATKGSEKTGKTVFEDGKVLRVPLIPDALAHVECLTNQIFISGDHAIVVGLVEEARTNEGQPLLYFAQQYGTFSTL
jgi:flavin reductase (DIM6/NTAB) family NADH-FMN oxidoreductase RutF